MTEQSPYHHKAQYYETDQMGVVHHSNYIRWFEEARTGELRAIGETRHAFLNRDFKPAPLKRNHPDVDKLMRRLSSQGPI